MAKDAIRADARGGRSGVAAVARPADGNGRHQYVRRLRAAPRVMAFNAIDGTVAFMIEACMGHPSRRHHLHSFLAQTLSFLKRRVVDVNVPVAVALLDVVTMATRALGFKAEYGVVRLFHCLSERKLLVVG
jgi:hypothetical protein